LYLGGLPQSFLAPHLGLAPDRLLALRLGLLMHDRVAALCILPQRCELSLCLGNLSQGFFALRLGLVSVRLLAGRQLALSVDFLMRGRVVAFCILPQRCELSLCLGNLS
jgi:hypothetical protein